MPPCPPRRVPQTPACSHLPSCAPYICDVCHVPWGLIFVTDKRRGEAGQVHPQFDSGLRNPVSKCVSPAQPSPCSASRLGPAASFLSPRGQVRRPRSAPWLRCPVHPSWHVRAGPPLPAGSVSPGSAGGTGCVHSGDPGLGALSGPHAVSDSLVRFLGLSPFSLFWGLSKKVWRS